MVNRDSHERREGERAEEKRVIAGFRFPVGPRRATVSSFLSFVGMLGLFVGCRGNAGSSTPPRRSRSPSRSVSRSPTI